VIPVAAFAGRAMAVVGLAKSGISAARSLAAGGAEVWAWDDAAAARAAAHAAGLMVVEPATFDWSRLAAVVLSPGIPLTHPQPHGVVARARAHAVPVFGDLELFARTRPVARIAGVTGTNGKSTTTALIGHLLAAAGLPVAVGGNLGIPVLDLPPLDASGVYVLELSSYQLDLTQSLLCDVAVLLNLTPDHLDRHGGMAGYVAAKRAIFRGCGTAIVGIDDADSRGVREALATQGGPAVIAISARGPLPPGEPGIFAREGLLYATEGEAARAIADLHVAPALRGEHNMQNAAAALAAVRALGVPLETVAAGLASFPGLAHRLQEVAVIDGIRFVNDSKATNGESAARALACFREVYWIVGGRPKAGGLAACAPYLDHVRQAFLIGEAAPAFAEALAGKVPCTVAGELQTAVDAAYRAARRTGAEAVVLLSPACASFDQWPNFEARGAAFAGMAAALAHAPDRAVPA